MKKKENQPNDLSEIRRLINENKYRIRTNALSSAIRDFGWNDNDIIDAIKKLKPKHYYKPGEHQHKPGIILDIYKARGLNNEDIYTHFYIDSDGYLIISSFKKI